MNAVLELMATFGNLDEQGDDEYDEEEQEQEEAPDQKETMMEREGTGSLDDRLDAFRARSVSIEVASDFATNAAATSGTVSLSSGFPSRSFAPRLDTSKLKQQQMQ
jgi:hypothetical protein